MTMYPQNNPMANLHEGKFTNGDPRTNVMPSTLPAETLNLILGNLEQIVKFASNDTNNFDDKQVANAVVKLVNYSVNTSLGAELSNYLPNFLWKDNVSYLQGSIVATVDVFGSALVFVACEDNANKHPHAHFGKEWKRIDIGASGAFFYSDEDHAPIGSIPAYGVYERELFPRIDGKWSTPNGGDPSTFVILDARGYVLRSLDLGRGADPDRGKNSHQEDAIRNIKGELALFNINTFYGYPIRAWSQNYVTGSFYTEARMTPVFGGNEAYKTETRLTLGVSQFEKSGIDRYPAGDTIIFDASKQVPTASENRIKNVALPLYYIV